MGFANKDAKDFAAQLGKMSTTATTTRGKISELSDAFVNLKTMYNQMTDAEKKGQFGKNLSASLDQLKQRINDAKKDLSSVTNELNGSKFGQFGSVIDTIGQKMGIAGNLTELITSKTALMTGAIGASSAAIVKATEAWVSYNSELAKQDQITAVTTGLKGEDANRLTDSARAMVDTYGVDFRQVINAANTLIAQFGQSGEQAVQLLREGMQGMIYGDGPKLLSMIQSFAPAFRDAGISADQLIAVIHNSEGGLFSEQNMNAILMGIKNIRLMTKSTSEALAQLGIDGEEMSRQMSDGSMTVFEALQRVAVAIEGAESGSKEAGEVMQYVFGRQGAMQGMKLGRAIAELNTNLEETKNQTGEVGKSYDELYDANVRLNAAIRDCFEYDGWDQMATGIKSNLVTALASVLESCKSLYGMLKDIGALKVFEFISGSILQCVRPFKLLYEYAKLLFNELGGGSSVPTPKPGITNLAADPNVDDNGNYIVKPGSKKGKKLVSKPGEPVSYDAAPVISRPITNTPKGGNRHPNLTPSQQAEADVQKALKEYSDAIANAQEKVMANMITGDDYNKQVQQGQQRLADAYLKAYNVTGNDQYLEGFKESAERYNEMSDVIKENIDTQKQQQQAARELEQAQKKMAEAQQKLADAKASGSATAVYKAQAAVDRLKNPKAQAQPTGFAALRQSIQGELKFDQMKVDETTLRTLLSTAIKNGIDEVTVDYNLLQDKISKGIDIPDSTWKELQDEINAKLTELGIEPIKIDFNTGGLSTEGKKAEKSWQSAAVAVSAVGSAIQNIEDPAAKVVGTVAQAIATVALSFAQAMAKTSGPWEWVAFAATGLATMISTISAIHSATGYANGGIVGGNSFSGDNVYGGPDAMVNSGELILNKAQQNVVAQELQGGSRMIQVHGVLRGKDIFIAAENWSKSAGKGEFVTW
jgi:hypothetical protein